MYCHLLRSEKSRELFKLAWKKKVAKQNERKFMSKNAMHVKRYVVTP